MNFKTIAAHFSDLNAAREFLDHAAVDAAWSRAFSTDSAARPRGRYREGDVEALCDRKTGA